jgi:hypothetical protein
VIFRRIKEPCQSAIQSIPIQPLIVVKLVRRCISLPVQSQERGRDNPRLQMAGKRSRWFTIDEDLIYFYNLRLPLANTAPEGATLLFMNTIRSVHKVSNLSYHYLLAPACLDSRLYFIQSRYVNDTPLEYQAPPPSQKIEAGVVGGQAYCYTFFISA